MSKDYKIYILQYLNQGYTIQKVQSLILKKYFLGEFQNIFSETCFMQFPKNNSVKTLLL